MDFFERQDQARRRTGRLIVYFILAVLGIVAAVYLACLLVFGYVSLDVSHAPGRASAFSWWRPQLFLWSSLGTLALVAGGSAWRIASLASGGGAVAESLGGRRLLSETRDLHERRLLNVVEEMSLASGVPMPDVYVLEDEPGINAFAAGHTPGDAAIGVTRGGLKLLTRDELQGVIGHEFSHILNGDMRLNIRLMGLIFGILCLTIVGRILLRTRGRRNPLPLLGLALLLIGFLGVFFGRLIQAAVSRQREYLADASAVQFTRNPAGLAGALKKIGGLAYGSRLRAPHAAEAGHLFFSNGVSGLWNRWLATHPPLTKRIRALDPQFDGHYPDVRPPADLIETPSKAASLAAEDILQQAGTGGRPSARPPRIVGAPEAVAPVRAEDLLPQVGTPTAQHLVYAADFQRRLPPRLALAAHEPLEAMALIYTLLLSAEAGTRRQQQSIVEQAGVAGLVSLMKQLEPDVATLERTFRLPLVMLALPALRQLSPAQFTAFSRTLRRLIEADRQVDLFEYTLHKIVLRHLTPHFEPRRRRPVQYYALGRLTTECSVVLSGLARLGHDTDQEARRAFEAGQRQLPSIADRLRWLPVSASGLDRIDAALTRLSDASPLLRRQVLTACAHAVAADGVIRPREAELLRAIADTLDCPIPPWVKGV